jgi:membrane protease YdiL (CAAX protease family)
MKYIKSVFIMLLLFLAVYVPSFILVSILQPSVMWTVIVIIITTCSIALLIIAIFLTRHSWQRKDFGLVVTGRKFLIWAFGLGAILGLIVVLIEHVFHIEGPRTFETFSLWQIVLLFWISASIQEEIIFRSLIQSVVGRTLTSTSTSTWEPLSAAAVITAILFALIHIPMGVFTACAAFIAGVLAGELRARSGSILPAMIVHAMLNITGTI